MTRVYTITALGSLLLGCAQGAELGSRQGQELQSEYVEREQDADACLESFGVCLAEAPDDDGISVCADELQGCLSIGLPDEDEDQNEDDDPFGESGDDPEDPEDDDPFDMDPGDEPDGDEDPGEDDDEDGAELGAECQPILDLCLDDPGNFDPFCLEDFEECIQVAVAFELKALCDEIEAKCLELEIPNFDCFDVCG